MSLTFKKEIEVIYNKIRIHSVTAPAWPWLPYKVMSVLCKAGFRVRFHPLQCADLGGSSTGLH